MAPTYSRVTIRKATYRGKDGFTVRVRERTQTGQSIPGLQCYFTKTRLGAERVKTIVKAKNLTREQRQFWIDFELLTEGKPRAVCACGHSGDGPNSAHATGYQDGHGRCEAPDCDCMKFTWARRVDLKDLTALDRHGTFTPMAP